MLPKCDAVQEYTDYNLKFSAKEKAFVIPHGVDTTRFHPTVRSDFRVRHGIPQDAFVVVSVGKVSRSHKRMDYVIREVARLPDVYLLIIGEGGGDTKEVKALGRELMGRRAVFERLPHEELPAAYAAGNVFVLGSLFETFGIVYIEALSMGLPVVCTGHLNQRLIVKEGLFIDMARDGALTKALKSLDRESAHALGVRSRAIAEKHYDLALLRDEYARRYREIAELEIRLPSSSLAVRIKANVENRIAGLRHRIMGRAE
jgi:glycosyltransferase involved in cell wall biosynthesis